MAVLENLKPQAVFKYFEEITQIPRGSGNEKEISDYLDNIGIGKNLKENKLANRRVRQITSLLYIFNRIISSNEIKNKANNEINNLIIRIKKHKEYYTNNELLKSIYHFFLAIVKANKIVLNSWLRV